MNFPFASFIGASKGQLISKENFGICKSTKKPTKDFCPSAPVAYKMGQIKKIKAHFYNVLFTLNQTTHLT
jgi:hypothetical protein